MFLRALKARWQVGSYKFLSQIALHSLAHQSSILRFVEDNWNLGRIGGTSFDAIAGALLNMFEFEDGGDARKLYLDPQTGQPR